MQAQLLELLRCPVTGGLLTVKDASYVDGRIQSGQLVSEDGRQSYPIRDFIPRFVPATNYADNFGMQWNKFRETQLDSHSGRPISADRFWKATGWRPAEISNKWVLDVGCGAGRFAEVALNAGARVVAVDYSSAADACFANLRGYPNINVVQGDIFALPFAPSSFEFVYSLGVLQHTPNVQKAFDSLPPLVKSGGSLVTDVYWRRISTLLHAKYLFRPVCRRMEQQTLFKALEKAVPALMRTSRTLAKIPLAGPYLKRLVPVADYTGVYDLSEKQLHEWALLDTFDMLAPRYDTPQTKEAMRSWMAAAGMQNIELLHANLLVARGRKP